MLQSLVLPFVLWSIAARAQQPSACADLVKLKLPETTITKAEQYAAGEFRTSPGAPPEVVARAKFLPALCRVVALLTPTSDSSIKIELWMPAEHWNGKFRGQGNGGFAGEISYELMGLSVLKGYATAGTDTGHSAVFSDADWANGHPEKIKDFGYRAVHLMTERSKQLVAAYYGTPAKHSYFAACSDGGREALMEAQRFPADYDGILAGAPANNWTALVTNSLHNAQAQIATPESYIPSSKLSIITNAVLAACDKMDGVADGVLADPTACHFHPSTLLCAADAKDTASCLTTPQIKTLEELYSGAHTREGKLIFPGYAVGGEADPGGWTPWITGSAPGNSLAFAFPNGYFANMVYSGDKSGKSDWDLKTASVDEAYKAANAKTASDLNATDPDLAPFIAHGGKLILYHGWSDPAISPFNTIDYYSRVLAATGRQATESSVRLYMAPGMDHCTSGPGPDSFGQFGWVPFHGSEDPKRNAYLALEQWVEQGVAPVEIVAAKYTGEGAASKLRTTRPLCPYPQVAKYDGNGDPDQASSFACTAGSR
jgi:feruloyl esterase